MCIRDSTQNGADIFWNGDLPLGHDLGVVYKRICRHVAAPVSYTHLDVYKRQVVMVAPVAAVAGAGRFAGLPPAVERPHARYRNFGGVPVLIAGGQRWKNHST